MIKQKNISTIPALSRQRPRIKWRTLLKFVSELPEDEWFTTQSFSTLFNVPLRRVKWHLHMMYKWGNLTRRKIETVKHGGCRYEYKISINGIRKIEYIAKKAQEEADFWNNRK